ncbi:uncharacterized protein LOC106169708 [Lingula anatina]|uniref:Uncharacterized protein LOC106169708 n=1 Tax=Lingula anatina TaxID=7574 RepID=A0A1S3J2V8_LINAN|nr:uncharacterized protein LOC106169708 [Lingula anatina]|eukprot:XP_013404745.1 uncharacterized protein LOC106169708 [Lingula anatina]
MNRAMTIVVYTSVLTVCLGLDYPRNGPCKGDYDGPYKESEVKEYTAMANCTEGRFDWNFPMGATLFRMQSSVYDDFQFCFQDLYGSQLAGYWKIYDVTGEKIVQIAKPTRRGQVVCRQSQNGRVGLFLQSTEKKTYAAAFAYKLESK